MTSEPTKVPTPGDTGVSRPQTPEEISLTSLSPVRESVRECSDVATEHNADTDEMDPLIPSTGPVKESDRYATVQALSKFIPELDPEHPRANTLRVKMAKRTTMLKIQLILAITITSVNIGTTIWVFIRYPPDFRGIGLLSFGSCSTLATIDNVGHMALNILSTLFLGAGNYCMQILVAPSRAEVDKAHSKGVPLSIGVQNIHNIPYIKRKRVLIWLLIGCFTTILHLFWNSAVFTSIPFVSYPRLLVTNDFQTVQNNWTISHSFENYFADYVAQSEFNYFSEDAEAHQYRNFSSVYSLQASLLSNSLKRLDKKSCIYTYIDPSRSTSSLIIVALNQTYTQNNGSSLIHGWLAAWDGWAGAPEWICSAHIPPFKHVRCTQEWIDTWGDDWTISTGTSSQQTIFAVDYCLIGETADNNQRCGIHYSAYILPIVCSCTFLESTLIFWTWIQHRKKAKLGQPRTDGDSSIIKTMVIMGDAVADFLKTPDTATEDNIDGASFNSAATLRPVMLKRIRWAPRHEVPWFKAISSSVRISSSIVFTIGLAVAYIFLINALVISKYLRLDISMSAIWQQGFQASANNLVTEIWFPTGHRRFELPSHILFANGFQLLFSFVYIFYNNIITRQLIAAEWIRFLSPRGKKPLRVSSPIGMQRSSYMLSLPMSYSVPLMFSFMLLHWLISQSVFVIQTAVFGPGSQPDRLPNLDQTHVGFSILGIILSTITFTLLLIGLVVNAIFRKFKDVPPEFLSMGTNSAAISAVCHPPSNDKDARLFPLTMGAVQVGDFGGTIDRLTFSTNVDIQELEVGKEYLQPIIVVQPSGIQKLAKLVRRIVIKWCRKLAKYLSGNRKD